MNSSMKRTKLSIGFCAFLILTVSIAYSIRQYVKRQHQYSLNAALVIAVRNMQTQDALLALQQGADPNARGYMVVPSGFDEWDKEIQSRETKTDPNLFPALMLAAERGDALLVEALCKKGADVNARYTENSTALHYGATSYEPKVISTLLKFGAYPLVRRGDGLSALDMAKRRSNPKMVAMLEKAEVQYR